MARRFKEEFYCTNCHKYFLTYLSESMFGNYTIECPACQHHHYRVVNKGVCTFDRHSSTYESGKSQLIMGLPSTVSEVPYHDDPDFKRQRLKVIPS